MADIRYFARSSYFGSLLAVALAASLLLALPAQAQTEPVSVGVTQTATPDPATVGAPVAFDVTLTNDSAEPQHLGLKSFLPDNVASVSATPGQGTCDVTGGNDVICPLGTVPSGSSVTVTVTAIPTTPGELTNLAVGGGESSLANSVPATVTVNPA